MSAVDGLITGMNTSDVIRQLMSLERQPQLRLQGRKATNDKVITALQGLNTKFLALQDLATKLGGTAWSQTKATSSHAENVSVTAAAATEPTSLKFKVAKLAAAHQIYSSSTYATETDAVASAGRDITIAYTDEAGAAQSLIVNNHDGTLKGIADAINGTAGSPIAARVVKTSDTGDYRLEFAANRTGASSAFTVTGIRNPPTAEMAFTTATQASNAELLVGTTNPMTITSTDNVFADIAPGVTVTALKADLNTQITIDVTRDSATIAGDVEKFVEAANAILSEIKTLTKYNADKKSAGLLQNNRMVRDLQGQILNAVATAVGGVSAATAGVELTRDGLLKFDKATFDSAYAADPAAVAAIFNGVGGLGSRMEAISDIATEFGTGRLTVEIESLNTANSRYDDSIALWDIRLARREATLRRQFAALETALGRAQQQGNWLSSQIASLPTNQ